MEVYFPGTEKWYDIKTGAAYAGGREITVPVTMEGIPVYQRAGTIIPRKLRHRRSSTQMENDPYTLVCLLTLLLSPDMGYFCKCLFLKHLTTYVHLSLPPFISLVSVDL